MLRGLVAARWGALAQHKCFPTIFVRLVADQVSTGQSSRLKKYRDEVHYAGRILELSDIFKACTEMKEEGIKPDAQIMGNLIEAYVLLQQGEKAIQTYNDMIALGIVPNTRVLGSVLKACESCRDLNSTTKILDDCRKRGIYPDATACSVLVNMYASAGDFKMLWHFYEQGLRNGSLTHRAFLTAFDAARLSDQTTKVEQLLHDVTRVQVEMFDGMYQQAFEVFLRWGHISGLNTIIKQFKHQMDEGSLLSALEVGASKHDFPFAKVVYELIAERFLQPSIYVFNAMLLVSANTNHQPEFLNTVNNMVLAGHGVSTMFLDMFSACCKTSTDMDRASQHLEEIHSKGQFVAIEALNAVLYACSRAGESERASSIFNKLEKFGYTPDTGTFVALLGGCVFSKDISKAFSILSQCKQSGIPCSIDVYKLLLGICYMTGDLPNATTIMTMVQQDGLAPTHSMYSQLVQICVDNNEYEQARLILQSFVKLEITPDADVERSIRDK